MYKMVNNERVKCTSEEEALIISQRSSGIDVDARKYLEAQSLINAPHIQAVVEEFASILAAANIKVPLDVLENITMRCKQKLL